MPRTSKFNYVIYLILTPPEKKKILGFIFSLFSVFLFNNFYDSKGFLPLEKITCGMIETLANIHSAHSSTRCMLEESSIQTNHYFVP